MSTRIPVSLIAGLIALALGGAEGCESTTTNKPDSSDGSGGGEDGSAEVGDAITLKDSEGNPYKVRVVKVIDPLKAGEFDSPTRGERYVGVRISINNVGDGTYNDSPSNGAALIDTRDEAHDPTILTGGPCGGGFSSSTRISAGTRRVGCIPFEVKKRRKLATFQFTLNSGFGPQTGEWSLR